MRSKDGSKGHKRPKRVSPLAQPKRVGDVTGRTDAEVISLLDRFGPQREGSSADG